MATAMQPPVDFAGSMERVALLLCGNLNDRMSKGNRLRFGTHGSMEVDVAEGWFNDHEANVKGGVLQLIRHKVGCDMHGALTWLEDQGLKDRDEPPRKSSPVFYDYHDAAGSVAYRVERRGKGMMPPFLHHGPDGKGGYHSKTGCMQGVSRLPYRLSQMMAADPAQIVFVVEGEKDADRLARAGLVATTNSGGANKFGAELARWFEGRRVAIIQDNDGPGREHSVDVAGKLAGVAASVAVIDLPDLPDKGDVSDWLDRGGTIDRLVAEFAEPALARSALSEPGVPAAATGDTRVLAVQRFKDIEPQLTGLWLIKHLLPASGLAVVHGHPNCGKSFFVMDMGFHVALGWEWQGRRTKAGLVIYIGAEGLAGLRNRIVAFRRENEISDMPFSLIPTPVDLQAADADIPIVIATIKQEAEHYGVPIAMIVIDTLSKTFGAGKENTDDMVSYVANCGRVANHFECCVLVVHHRPKDAESEEPRGHSSLKGGVDTVILVEAGSTKSARVIKQRDGDLGSSILFTLKPVELGEDEDGEIVTSCVIQPAMVDDRPAGDPIALAMAKLPDGAKLVLKQLHEAIEHQGFEPPSTIPDTEINRRRVGKVVKTGTWREKVIMGGGTERDTDRDTAKRAFNRALIRLQKDGIVRVWGEYTWREFGASGQGGTDQVGHSRDTGHTGTHPLRGVPVVPPRSIDRSGYIEGNPALGPVDRTPTVAARFPADNLAFRPIDEDDPAADAYDAPRTVF